MGRVKRVARDPETVQLVITGAPSVLKETITVHANLSQTWKELLDGELGLEVDPQSGIFVSSSSYTLNGSRGGWRSELNEEIRDFIGKFETKRQRYSVRLRYPTRSSLTWNQLPRNGSSRAAGTRSTRRKPNIVIPTKGEQLPEARKSFDANEFYGKPRYRDAYGLTQTGNQRSQQQVYGTRTGTARNTGHFTRQANLKRLRNNKILTTFRRQRQLNGGNNGGNGVSNDSGVVKVEMQNPEPEEDDDEGVEAGNDNGGNSFEQMDRAGNEGNGNGDDYSIRRFDDNSSWRTAAATEVNELRQEGIEVEDVKSLVRGRVDRFSNAFMLRARHEIRILQENHRWDRIVSRAPRACYMVQELFK